MNGPKVLGKTAAVRERSAAAPTDVRLHSGMAELVRAESLFGLERLPALGTDVAGCGRVGPVHHHMGVER